MIAVCIGGGASLTFADVEHCRGRARVYGINNAYQIAPWADVIYGCDWGWWNHHIEAVRKTCTGELWTQDADAARVFGLQHIECDPMSKGLCTTPGKIHGGMNGGYQTIGKAFHDGARKIVLLGYDMLPGHWHGDHPREISGPGHAADYPLYASNFPALAIDLDRAGIEVVNCSRNTALTCFRRSTIEAEI